MLKTVTFAITPEMLHAAYERWVLTMSPAEYEYYFGKAPEETK